MTEYGVTENGFVIKPYAVILDELKNDAKTYLGEDVYLGAYSRLLRFFQVIAYKFDEYWQLMEAVYNAGYIDFSTSVNLEHVVAIVGFVRRPAQCATGLATFSRTTPAGANITIPAGTRIETEDGTVQFRTTAVAILELGETEVEVAIEAVLPGADGNVAQSTITELVDPVSGIEDVINDAATENGADQETDSELRLREKTDFARSGKASFDAILANIREVENVDAAILEQNDTNDDNTGTGGLPPHSIRATVYGGEDNDIAQAIFDTKATGIEAYGPETGTATDQDGVEYEINFRRPSPIDIYVAADVETDGTEVTEQQVKDAITGYINALTIGADVIFNKVVAAIMVIPGVTDVALLIDKETPPTGEVNIEIASDEIAVTDDEKISVGIT